TSTFLPIKPLDHVINGNHSLVIPLGYFVLYRALGVVLTAMLALVDLPLGCTVEVGNIWLHLCRPWGILVGLLCQFGFMHLTAYLLILGCSVQPVQSVALIIMGCCPGGVISNIVTYWMNGDMDLRLVGITMTTISTVLGMGMMPLCLYVYTHSCVEAGNIRKPYFSIDITLITLVVPAALGVFVNYKWHKAARKIFGVGTVVGVLLLMVVGIEGAVLYQAIFPLIGYSAEFIITVIAIGPIHDHLILVLIQFPCQCIIVLAIYKIYTIIQKFGVT
uniref:Solute carrier family 10 member 6 n=1 Tax=Hucho hucho TaxID=62062 RepID=A0A4W5QXF7_9TELE